MNNTIPEFVVEPETSEAEMTKLRLKWLEQEDTLSPLAIGKFNKDLVPELELKTFNEEMTVRMAVSPDCGFRLLKEAFEAATQSLDIYIYNISAGHIVKLVKESALNLKVRVMYDVHDDGANELAIFENIDGIEFKTAPSSKPRSAFTVCHQKLIIVDGREVFMGSANFAGTSFPFVTEPGIYKKGNREWVIRVKNENVAIWFAELFQKDWDIPASGSDELAQVEIDEAPGLPETPLGALKEPEEVADIEGVTAKVRLTPVVSPDNYFAEVLAAIQGAESSICVQQQDIKAKFKSTAKVDQLLEALKERKKAGVKVRVMVSAKYSWDLTQDSMKAYGLQKNLRAIDLHYFTHLHNKGIIIDGKKVLVTSTNLTENSINFAREAGVLVEHEEIAQYYQKCFDQDWDSGLLPEDVPQHLAEIAAETPDAMVTMDSNPIP